MQLIRDEKMECSVNIYIGNVSFDTTEEQLRQAFESYGEVSAVNIISDRDTGRPRGFAFVEMSVRDNAIAAISGLNGREMNGRTLNVGQAKSRPQNGNHSGGNTYRSVY
jgi:cold-inducible RNA-binding protein